MSRIVWELSPKPAADYSLIELEKLLTTWGSYRWAANSINQSVYAYRKALNLKRKEQPNEL